MPGVTWITAENAMAGDVVVGDPIRFSPRTIGRVERYEGDHGEPMVRVWWERKDWPWASYYYSADRLLVHAVHHQAAALSVSQEPVS